ncbi:phage virion morphogenesis protein, partial [Salmonella enterica subsp. enterica serovar Rissen]|nr:phage virion morphogenesis protein [Salmonella enterica subsp. enterica serovar Rissen]
KTAATADSASVEFAGQVQRIARVHHYGLRDRITKLGPLKKYPERRLLGHTNNTVELVKSIMLDYMKR